MWPTVFGKIFALPGPFSETNQSTMSTAAVLTAPAVNDVNSPTAGRVALKGFFAITDRWGLAAKEQQVLLGGIGRTTFAKYRKLPEVALARDTLERISYVFGIQKALLILFGSEKRAGAWLRKPNRAQPFNGRSALDRMLAGSITDLAAVRHYLDAMRG
jgi:uncharacterized protein (DUF2384 family)